MYHPEKLDYLLELQLAAGQVNLLMAKSVV